MSMEMEMKLIHVASKMGMTLEELLHYLENPTK